MLSKPGPESSSSSGGPLPPLTPGPAGMNDASDVTRRLSKSLDSRMHIRLRRLVIEAEVNKRLDEQLRKRVLPLLTKKALEEAKAQIREAEASINSRVDAQNRLRLQLMGSNLISPPKPSFGPQDAGTKAPPPGRGEASLSEEDRLAAKFSDALTLATEATARGETANAKRYFAQADEIWGQMKNEVTIRIVEGVFGPILIGLGVAASSVFSGMIAEGLFDFLEVSEVPNLLGPRFIAQPFTKGVYNMLLNRLMFKRGMKRISFPPPNSEEAKKEGDELSISFGVAFLSGVAEANDYEGLALILERLEEFYTTCELISE